MKYIKLFMLLAVVAFFGACSSDDDSWNTASDVIVSMENATMNIKESQGLTNVPIKVTGKTNGNVYVTVEVKEVGSNPAKEIRPLGDQDGFFLLAHGAAQQISLAQGKAPHDRGDLHDLFLIEDDAVGFL